MTIFLRVLSSLIVSLAIKGSLESSNGINITRGSSLSTSPNNESNGTTFWLSPSGNFAFGFYPLCSDCPHYFVGIWLVKSANKTLVWTANLNHPLHHPSKILFNNDGKLVVQTADGRETSLLPNMWEPASHAAMLDNGNFVLYGSNSKIIWESFDHPTNTILGGQTLKSGQALISSMSMFDHSHNEHKLMISQKYTDLVIQHPHSLRSYTYVSNSHCNCSNRREETDITPMTLKLDPTTGQLYIVDWNNLVLRNLTQGENQHQQEEEKEEMSWVDNTNINDDIKPFYRATLGTDGIFRLYKERIGSDSAKSILLWDSCFSRRRNQNKDSSTSSFDYELFFLISLLVGLVLGSVGLLMWCERNGMEKEKQQKGVGRKQK